MAVTDLQKDRSTFTFREQEPKEWLLGLLGPENEGTTILL